MIGPALAEGPRRLFRALDALCRGGIGPQPANANEFSAAQATAKLALHQAPERSLNPGAPRLPAPFRRYRHCLDLHCVHARQPSDALLIELDRPVQARRLRLPCREWC